MTHNAEEQIADFGAMQMARDRGFGAVVDLIEFHEIAPNVKVVQATKRQKGGDDAQENEEAKDAAVKDSKRWLVCLKNKDPFDIDSNFNKHLQCANLDNRKRLDFAGHGAVFLWNDLNAFSS